MEFNDVITILAIVLDLSDESCLYYAKRLARENKLSLADQINTMCQQHGIRERVTETPPSIHRV